MGVPRIRRLIHSMVNKLFLLILLFSFVFSPYSSIVVFAAPGVPEVISHQGRLLDSSGNLLGGSGGTNYCFRFSFFDDVTVGGGDNQLWPGGTPSTMTASVVSGVFNVGIGDVSAGGDTLDFDFNSTDTAYLNTEVAAQVSGSCVGVSFENLSPRQKINSSGYAINASTVGGFTPAQSATGDDIVALTSDDLILGGTNPDFGASGSNTLTIQGNGATGNINFFSASNSLSSTGNLDVAGTLQSGSSNVALTLATGFVDADALTLTTAADGGTGTSSGSGLIARSDGIGLLQGCSDGQILKWAETTDTWDCAADAAGGGGGATTALDNLASVAINTSLVSDTDNTDALGSATIGWSDLFLGGGAVINFNNGDVIATHSADTLTFSGGTVALGTATATGGLTANVTGALTGNADTATALAANPADCGANSFATQIAANGNLTCATITDADVPNTISVDLATTAGTLTGLTSSVAELNILDGVTSSAAELNLLDGITVLSGSNTGDQTSIVGITGTVAQFNTALTDGDFATGGGTATGTNTGDQTTITGNAGTVTFADAGGDTTTFVALGTAATGSLAPATDAGLSYNATTNALTAATFIGGLTGDVTGNLTGNVTGNVSGSSGSTTGNAATATALAADPADCGANTFATTIAATGALTCASIADADVPNSITIDLATLASTVTVVDSTDATSSIAMFDSATGTLAAKTDGSLTYNATTGALTATTFVGAVTGAATDLNCTDCIGPTEITDLTLGTDTAGNYVATVTGGAGLTGSGASEGSTPTLAVVSGNGGIVANADDITLTVLSAADALSATTSTGSGLQVLASGLGLLQGCSNGQVLQWVEATDTWDCTTPAAGSGDITSVGDVTSGAAFDGTQGTTLTFDDADGDKTFSYDTTNNEFDVADDLNITGTLVTSGGLTVDATTETNIEAALDTLSSVTTVGALNAGSITSGFGAIDIGADNFTTTGTANANDFTRSTAGALTFGATNATSVGVGSASVTAFTVTTDGTGTSEIVLPAGSIDSTEILDATVVSGDLATQGTATDEFCLTSETGGGAALAWQDCSSSSTLQTAYTNGTGAVTTTTGKNIAFTLADVVTPTRFEVTNADPSAAGIMYLDNAAATTTAIGLTVANSGAGDMSSGLTVAQIGAGTLAAGVHVYSNDAGNITSGILIEEAAGNSITNGIRLTNSAAGTFTTGIKFEDSYTSLIDAPNFDVLDSGNIDTAGTITAGSGNEVLTLSTGKIDAGALTIVAATDGLTGTSSASGLAVHSDGLGLLQGCTDGQVLKWVESTDTWDCSADSGGSFDSTTVDSTTWSDGANASNVWTFDVSGTDTTMTFGSGLATFSNGVTVTGVLATSGGLTIDATTESNIEAALDTLSSVTTVGALNAGSITSGFGAIDTGADNITTTGVVSTDTLTLTNTGTLNGLDVIDATGEATLEATLDIGSGGGDVASTTTGMASLTIAANAVALTTDTTGNYVSSATLNGGLTMTGTEGASLGVLLPSATDNLSSSTGSGSGLELTSSGLSLVQGCAEDQALFWSEASDTWDCDIVELGNNISGSYVASVTTSILTGLTGGNTAGSGTNSALAFDYSQALSGDPALGANAGVFGANGLVFEGSAANTFETFLAITNPTADRTITFPDATITVNAAGDITGTTLASNVVTSSLTTVGALNAGSITSGFGAIDTGADAITTSGTIGTAATTTFTGAGATFTAALAANGGITFDASTDTVSAFTANGTIDINTQTLAGTTGRIDYTNFDVGATGNTDIGGTITAGSGNTAVTLSTGMIDADAITLVSATDALTGTSSASGLAVYSDGLSLLQGCSDGQVLAWVESTDTWDCATAGGGSGDITSVGDVASGAAFDGTQGTTLTFNDTDGDQTLSYDTTNNKFVFSDNLSIGSAGVDFTTDGDGALTFLGLGDGSDENLTINFDDTSNVVSVSSSTGVTRWDFGAINPSVNDLGFIADANGNELIILDTVASAVNEVTVSNAATGNAVTLAASGGDTDVSLNLTSKGAGVVRVNGDNVLDECIVVAVGDEYSNMTTGTNKAVFRMPFAMTVRSVRASVVTAPTGSVATWDINDGGTTILSTKLTIDASEKTSTTAAAAAVISDTALADDAEISIDRDGVGSTIAGAGDKITICGAKDI